MLPGLCPVGRVDGKMPPFEVLGQDPLPDSGFWLMPCGGGAQAAWSVQAKACGVSWHCTENVAGAEMVSLNTVSGRDVPKLPLYICPSNTSHL